MTNLAIRFQTPAFAMPDPGERNAQGPDMKDDRFAQALADTRWLERKDEAKAPPPPDRDPPPRQADQPSRRDEDVRAEKNSDRTDDSAPSREARDADKADASRPSDREKRTDSSDSSDRKADAGTDRRTTADKKDAQSEAPTGKTATAKAGGATKSEAQAGTAQAGQEAASSAFGVVVAEGGAAGATGKTGGKKADAAAGKPAADGQNVDPNASAVPNALVPAVPTTPTQAASGAAAAAGGTATGKSATPAGVADGRPAPVPADKGDAKTKAGDEDAAPASIGRGRIKAGAPEIKAAGSEAKTAGQDGANAAATAANPAGGARLDASALATLLRQAGGIGTEAGQNAGQGGDKANQSVSSVNAVAGAAAAPAAAQTDSASAASLRPAAQANAAQAADLTQQVAVQIAKHAAPGGTSKFEIRLDPPELGRIEVRLEIHRDGQVHAILAADRPETLELLNRDSRGLERALQDVGLKADSGSLSFSLRQDTRRDGQSFQSFQGTGGRSGGRDSGLAEPDPVAMPAKAWLSRSGGLDIRI